MTGGRWKSGPLCNGLTIAIFATLPVITLALSALAAILAACALSYGAVQSRYRMALLPLLSVVLGLGTAHVWANGPSGIALMSPVLLLCVPLALLFRSSPARHVVGE